MAAITTAVATTGAGLYSSRKSAKASASAAKTQAESADRAAQMQAEAAERIRGDLRPFKQAGENQLGRLATSVRNMPTRTGLKFDAGADDALQRFINPSAQAAFLKSDPLYKAIADDTERRLNARAAASGKLHSGGTADALQNQLFLLGRDRVNDRFNQLTTGFGAAGDMLNREAMIEGRDVDIKNARVNNLFNLATMGQNAAAQSGTATQNAATNMGNLAVGAGNAMAAGAIGAANARAQGVESLSTGLGTILKEIENR